MTFANSRAIVIGAALASLLLASADAEPARTLRGSVEGGEQGEPVWIGVFGNEAAEGNWTQATGANFEVALPPDEPATLLAVSKNRVPRTVAVGGGSPTTVALRLEPGLALAGTVRSEDGTRLANAEVSIEPAETDALAVPPRAAPIWRSNRRGEFELGGLRPGRHSITLKAEGHVPRTFGHVQVREGSANGIEVNLPIAHFIAGRVVDTDGASVPGVDVVADMRGRRTTTQSGKDGAYRLGPFPRGERVSLFARSPGRGSTLHHNEIMAPMDGLVLVFRQYAIVGRLVDETTGAAVRKFRLTLIGRGEDRWEYGFESDNGRFRVPLDEIPMEGGAHSLVVQAQGYPPRFTRLTPADGEEIDLGEIVLVPGRSLSGRVVDSRTGNPIPGARIDRGPRGGEYGGWRYWLENTALRTVADDKGWFVLDAVPPETIRVSASAEGYGTKFIDLPHGVPRHDFELEAVAPAPRVVITGSIVLADGTPVRGGVVALFHADDAASADVGYDSESIAYAMMLENGGFRLARRGLADGAYVLVASSDAGVVARRTVAIRDGRSVEDVRLVVQEGNWLRISMAGLLPAEGGAKVIIGDEEGRAVFNSRFGNGTHRVSGVPDEAVVVANAWVGGQSRWFARKIRLGDGAEASAHFDFTARSRLRGTITAGGRPLSGIQFRVLPARPSAPKARSRTNHQGRYDVYGIAEGLHLVRTAAGHSFEVHVAQDTQFDIELPAVSLAGVLRLASSGRPVSQAQVRLKRSGGHSDFARTALDGSFRFDGLVAGVYVVSVSEPGFERVSRNVWIAGDESLELELAENGWRNGAPGEERHDGQE